MPRKKLDLIFIVVLILSIIMILVSTGNFQFDRTATMLWASGKIKITPLAILILGVPVLLITIYVIIRKKVVR